MAFWGALWDKRNIFLLEKQKRRHFHIRLFYRCSDWTNCYATCWGVFTGFLFLLIMHEEDYRQAAGATSFLDHLYKF